MGAPYDDERLTAMGLFVETYRALSAATWRPRQACRRAA
jgi:hypothetical protein